MANGSLLSAGRNQLAQINRQRQLAAGLQQSALSFDPIQHPLQGFAKLAQALASLQIEARADKREQDLQDKRRDALARALDPTIGTGESVQLPPTNVPLERIGTAPPDNLGITTPQPLPPEQLSIPGRRVQTRRPKTLTESIAGLPADIGEGIAANVLQQQALAMAGVTPEQLRSQFAQSPFELKIRGALRSGLPQQAIRGMVAQDIGITGVNVFRPGSDRPIRALQLGGRLYRPAPITDDNIFGIGEDITDQSIQAGVSIQPTDFSAFGEEESDAKNILIGYRQSVGIIDSIARDVSTSGDAALAFTGRASTALNSLVQQLQASAKIVGRSFQGRQSAVQDGRLTAEVGGQIVPEAELFNPDLYDLDTSALANTAQQAQRIKTQSIKLAYAMARADDPGGRLSERDVQAQLDAMGLDQGSAQVALTALGALRELLDRNTSISLDVMSDGTFQFSPEPTPSHLQNFMGQRQTPIQDFSGFQEGQEVKGSDGFIYVFRGGVPVPTNERWR